MEDATFLFVSFLNVNKALFKVAYHALSSAMYCALDLQDGQKMKNVERLAREQFQLVKANAPSNRSYPSCQPTEVGLYTSLIEIAAT